MADRLTHYLSISEDHDCGHDVWTGRWPGDAECEAYDFWCVGPPWRTCSKDTPGATHDLNRLVRECTWNKKTRRFEKSEKQGD
jgi:hypothetical protein